jgi:hypothetical protein
VNWSPVEAPCPPWSPSSMPRRRRRRPSVCGLWCGSRRFAPARGHRRARAWG